MSASTTTSNAESGAPTASPANAREQISALRLGKRTEVSLLVKSYYFQLTEGCFDQSCKNEYCKTSYHPGKPTYTNNEAAKKALELAKRAYESTPFYAFCNSINPVLPVVKATGETCAQAQAIVAAIDVYKFDTAYLPDILQRVFSNSESLNGSFLTTDAIINPTTFQYNSYHGIDIEGLSAVYDALDHLKSESVTKTLTTALETVAKQLLKICKSIKTPAELRQYSIILMCPLLIDPSTHHIVATIMKAILLLPPTMVNIWKTHLSQIPRKIFSKIISIFQQYITVQLYHLGYIDENIAYATRVLGVLDDANERKLRYSEKVPYNEFYNDGVNSIVDLKQDYARWKRGQQTVPRSLAFEDFAFTNYPFILDPASKTKILQIDATFEQSNEFRKAVVSQLFAAPTSLFLVLKVHRENLMHTAINEILSKSHDLKKPLKVVFVGEEGVDEGGVRKEFFQLIVRQIFDVSFGMFTYNEETRTFWFNPNSLENEDEFNLIGTIIGLAIYNGVILDVHFPLVSYKKLLGFKPTLEDLKEADPSLGKGLQQLLDFEGDVEETYCRTFQVETEAFGKIVTHDLKPNGGNIMVTNANRQEYVDLFVKWKLEDSVKKQFGAFAEGFHRVCGGPVLKLFRPEELELLVCGSPVLDFDALEKSTKYADGFTKEHPLIRAFWEIVKEFSVEDKKKFLAFCTGSDRVPIRGLGNLQFVIIRNGPDSERLPTAHTCFNYLLLPEYKTKEKLKERLTNAITNFEGFGLM